MKLKILLRIIAVCWGFSLLYADNPIIQTWYTADPAPLVYNDKVYLYTSHDEDITENNFFTMRDWKCFSSYDMVNWTDHGSIASLKSFNWLGNINNGAWAPHCIYRNGKFYLYVPIHGKGIGVLVSDSPTGPFKDPLGKALINKNGYDDIDPTAFVDTDGQAYLYWGNPSLWYVKLNADMISYSGDVIKVPFSDESFGKRTGESDGKHTHSYEEGPWFYKRNNLYYMIFSGGPLPEHIAYSTSNGPTGPWKYRGIIMKNQEGLAFTNHAGVCDFKGNSYFFYHSQTLPGGGGFKRSVCVEQFTYNSDGSIPTIIPTKEGAPQVGSFNPYDTVQAETMCWSSGIKTEVCSEGGLNVCNIDNGDFIKMKGVDFGEGAISFEARVASNSNGGKIELRLGNINGTLIGTCEVVNTGGWQKWTTKTCNVNNAKGKHDLYLKFTGSSSPLFNINWWKFNRPEVKQIGGVKKISGYKDINIEISNNTSLNIWVSDYYSNKNLEISLVDMLGRRKAFFVVSNIQQNFITFSLNKEIASKGIYVILLSVNKNLLLTKRINIK